ncbi:MAG: rhomboid family intramembrane serine protease [Phycisphaeraceae bacterium]|nr:rhomboid family intramembrane serine protease [Phycisphaerales bacterium]MCB9844019.1 rhomboid family intramembrane serine protease [Phycisphaeraceae bacterium]
MFIPIATDRPRRRPTVITYWLMAINILIFIVGYALMHNDEDRFLAMQAKFMLFPVDFLFHWWQLITYQFLHADWMHILGNMLFLFVFGPPVEDRFGRVGFLAFYLVGGVAAGAIHMAFSDLPVLGASGAISAVTGAFLVLFPLTHIRVLLFFFIIGVYSIPSWWFIAFAIARDLFFQGLGGGEGSGVAYMAHIGGYIFGASIPITLLWLHAIPREPFDLFSIGRQAKRRRDFKALTHKTSPWRADLPSQSRVGAASGKSKRAAPDDAITTARAEVSSLIATGEIARATDKYIALLDKDADATMNRDAQLVIANHLATESRHTEAVAAYDRFIARFPTDRETPRLKLMIALFSARYLNDPIRASRLLEELRTAHLDESAQSLADQLREEIA